jgi:hypothetical protein
LFQVKLLLLRSQVVGGGGVELVVGLVDDVVVVAFGRSLPVSATSGTTRTSFQSAPDLMAELK